MSNQIIGTSIGHSKPDSSQNFNNVTSVSSCHATSIPSAIFPIVRHSAVSSPATAEEMLCAHTAVRSIAVTVSIGRCCCFQLVTASSFLVLRPACSRRFSLPYLNKFACKQSRFFMESTYILRASILCVNTQLNYYDRCEHFYMTVQLTQIFSFRLLCLTAVRVCVHGCLGNVDTQVFDHSNAGK